VTVADTWRGFVALVTSERVGDPRNHHLFGRSLTRAGIAAIEFGQPDPQHPGGGSVQVQALPLRRTRLARMLSAPLTLARVARARPGLIQLHSLDLLPWAVLARPLVRCPVIYDAREDYASFMLLKEWVPKALRPVLAKVVASVEPWLAGRLDATLTADVGTAELFDGRVERVLLVHNFPWIELLPRVNEQAEPRYDVVYHGTVSSYHTWLLTDTARRLRERRVEARWCIAARDFGSGEQKRLERRLQASGVSDVFTLRYNIPFESVPALLTESRIGFVPLPDEPKFRRNLPRKLFEILALGRPAVVSDLPPIRALVGQSDCCLLVPPGDIDGYAEAIVRLIENPPLAHEMGARGRALIEGRLNAEREMQPYVALCRELLGRRER
jgi:glycosyltransferase involved in cell wall biosynthesis